MSRNSRSEQRKSDLIKQQNLIEQKKLEITKKNQAKELLEKYKQQTNRSAPSSHSVSLQQQLNAIPSSSSSQHKEEQIIFQLNDIPPPRELDLSLIPKPSTLKLDDICMPPESKIKIPKSRSELIELVSANGDGYEENLIIKCNKDDLDPTLGFLFDKSCVEYLEYRREVMERRSDKYDPLDELQYEDYKNAPSMMVHGPKTFGFHYSQQQATQEKVVKNVTVIRNDDSESTNSDTETWNSIKERNLKNLKRKAIHSRSRKQQDVSTTDSSEDNEHNHKDSYYERKYKMSSAASSSSSHSKKSGDLELQSQQQQQQQDQANVQSSESSSRPPKRKKSRWSEAPKVQTVVVPPPVTNSAAIVSSSTASSTATSVIDVKPMLSTVTRSDPALLNYARQNFGTTNLSEEDWKKAEEHFKINLLFQDMQRKRQEIDQLAKKGKFKYEYDSDEDCNGGTWEHKLRSQEMEATLKWAEALNQQCQGKHHIGDFLPPEELKKFMEKYQAQKKNQTCPPDVSDYKEFKLKEDNIGYQMLQKLGWKGEGNSLGTSGTGILEPINKAAPRENLQGLGVNEVEQPNENDNEYEVYRKRMMLAYRFRPNPWNNPRRAYY
ncbi:hypothetical protein PVAND_003240 [Polypedilum vanderplanki]|uniref:G-patch domain-containing protein n=1 Tax=Polypedilum vanderplanki TaxID=319348 RepID=A0A9J6BUE7_POLVA|nr:hypothetical protein PVAND_003240 [Polypedilum vanderplanki]